MMRDRTLPELEYAGEVGGGYCWGGGDGVSGKGSRVVGRGLRVGI